MFKLVNGEKVMLTDQEATNVNLFWSLNKTNPKFSGYLMFDGLNTPSYDIPACKILQKNLLDAAIAKGILDLTTKIQIAQEEGLDLTSLYAQRSAIRNSAVDMSAMTTIDEISAAIPDVLKSYME